MWSLKGDVSDNSDRIITKGYVNAICIPAKEDCGFSPFTDMITVALYTPKSLYLKFRSEQELNNYPQLRDSLAANQTGTHLLVEVRGCRHKYERQGGRIAMRGRKGRFGLTLPGKLSEKRLLFDITNVRYVKPHYHV